MFKKDMNARDAFAYSLGGMRTITSFSMAPAIAHDRLRQDLPGKAPVTREKNGGLQIPRLIRVF